MPMPLELSDRLTAQNWVPSTRASSWGFPPRACGSILVALPKAVYSIRENEAGTVIDPREEVGCVACTIFFFFSL